MRFRIPAKAQIPAVAMKAARQQQIVELLNQHHTLTTEALSHLLPQVSIGTIRRDLNELQRQGAFSVVTGGREFFNAIIITARSLFRRRVKATHAHKSDIARTALAWD